MTPVSEPKGVSLHDEGSYRTETRWTIWDRGRWRVLRLQVGRGFIEDAELGNEFGNGVDPRESRPGRDL